MNQTAQSSFQFNIRDLLVFTIVASVFALLMRWYGVAPILPWAWFYCLVHFLFLVGRFLAVGVKEAEQHDPTAPKKVAVFDSFQEASLMVSRLKEYGIAATAVGGFISGFVAESPGFVDVMVPSKQFSQATELVEEWGHQ